MIRRWERSTLTITSWPRVRRLCLAKVSRWGIWSSFWLPGMYSIAPFASVASVKATHAVTTSCVLRPQYVESWWHDTKAGSAASLMKKLVVQHSRSGPWRSSTVSRIELRRTSSASQVNNRCDLWRISPWSGPPVRRSNASSRPRSSVAAVSDMMRIGKTQPSTRYCSIWAGVRHFGIDPRARANRITTTPRTERPRSILPRLREARGRKSGGERVWTNPTTIGPEIWALRL